MILPRRYRQERELGRGGMGQVILALDQELGRRVAIKMLAPNYLSRSDVRSRFVREAKVQGMAAHPHVVQILDSDLSADQPYLVMEYIEGRDLESWLSDRGPMPLEAVLRLGRELAGALDHLHSQGVIHRDLKPPNVMIRDRDGAAVLMDLGLAAVEGATALTETGSLLGTPFYLPPEMLAGDGWLPASDQYQLGAILFEAIAGIRLITAFGMPELLAKVGQGHRNLFPDSRAPAPHVVAALERATALSPASRFASCSDLIDAMEDPAWVDPRPFPPSDASQPLLSGGFGAVEARPGPTGSFPGAGPRLLAPLLVALLLVLLAVRIGRDREPRDVQWKAAGDALICEFEGGHGVTLHVGSTALPAPSGQTRTRLVHRGLVPGSPQPAWLSWSGGEGPRTMVEAQPPAVSPRLHLGPGRTLRARLERPVRVAWRGAGPGEDLSPGDHPLLPPAATPWVLVWDESGIVSERPVDLERILADESRRLLSDFSGLDLDANPMERRGRRDEGLQAARRGAAPLVAWSLELFRSGLARPERARLWNLLQDLARSAVQDRALGHEAEFPAPPPGAPGSRSLDPHPGGTHRESPALRPVDGYGHEPEQGFTMVPETARLLRTARFQDAATQVAFVWPATPEGALGDPWLEVSLSGASANEELVIRAEDSDPGEPRFRFFHPRPSVEQKPSAMPLHRVRIPAGLAPAPGTSMIVTTQSLLRPEAYGLRLRSVRVIWSDKESS